MPPKNKKNNNSNKQHQSEEELLRQFEQEAKKNTKPQPKKAAAASSKADQQQQKMTLAERKAAHAKAKKDEESTASTKAAEALAKQLEQQKLQAMFQQMMQQQMMSSPYRSSPDKTVTVEEKGPSKVIKGGTCAATICGWRKTNEDAEVVAPDHADDLGLFAVFDGHSGVKAGQMCRQLLPIQFDAYRQGKTTDLEATFMKTYQDLDGKMKGKIADDSGCTAVTVAVTADTITCASVGDSRAVICRGGKAIPLAFDHKPENAEEKARIEKAGGHVANNRVNGELAMSRAMGDFRYKGKNDLPPQEQLVISKPDVISEKRDAANDEFLVVACDGVGLFQQSRTLRHRQKTI